MIDFRTLGRSLGPLAIGAGLIVLPLAAQADAGAEISTAAEHAGYASKADSIKMVHTHMHHAINCLVGPNGNGFDPNAMDPCKGKGDGAIPDTQDAQKKQKLESVADNLRSGLKDDTMSTAQKTAATAQDTLKSME